MCEECKSLLDVPVSKAADSRTSSRGCEGNPDSGSRGEGAADALMKITSPVRAESEPSGSTFCACDVSLGHRHSLTPFRCQPCLLHITPPAEPQASGPAGSDNEQSGATCCPSDIFPSTPPDADAHHLGALRRRRLLGIRPSLSLEGEEGADRSVSVQSDDSDIGVIRKTYRRVNSGPFKHQMSPPRPRGDETGNMGSLVQGVARLLSEHPAVVGFRWSHSHTWGSTWSFLCSFIALYLAASIFLHLLLLLFRRRRAVPLGPIPVAHSLAMMLISLAIFLGTAASSAAEIRDTRWFWRRSKTPLQWLLCFPLGTRPTGRVFFWSYVFYLSRFLQLLHTFISILRRKKLTLYRLFHHPILLCMSFLWLEFSQSFQLIAILFSTLVYSIVYGCRCWVAIGLPGACFPFILNCHLVLLACNLICHLGVLLLHFTKGGCNGIGAWVFNSGLNGALLLLFLNSHVKGRKKDATRLIDDEGGGVSRHSRSSKEMSKDL